MIHLHNMNPAVPDDSTLVAQCLSGNRDAFGEIVIRYQSLICSVAYSATGSLTQSEDLAQETFITAWKELSKLGEPSKLRPWLCGIARNLIGKALRHDGREPVSQAAPMDQIDEAPAIEPLPLQQAISGEEEAILWRTIETIPMIYREPLVLYYREHQSVETVAAALDLTEEATRQRLARGRKMLHDQVLAFVENTLSNSRPDKAFTAGVLAALPLLTTVKAASTATVGFAAAKSGTAKTIAVAGMSSAVLGILPFISLLGFFMFLGASFGCLMAFAIRQSNKQVEAATRFWRAVARGYPIFVVMPALLAKAYERDSAMLYQIWFWSGFIHVFIPILVILWLWRWNRYSKTPETELLEPAPGTKTRFYRWFGFGLIVPAGLMLLFLKSLVFATSSLQASISGVANTPPNIEVRPGAFFILAAGITLLIMNARKSWRYSYKATPQYLATVDRIRMNLLRAMAAGVAVALLVGVGGLGLITRWNTKFMGPEQLPAMLDAHKFDRFQIYKYSNGSRELLITSRATFARAFSFPADNGTTQLLQDRNLPFNTYVQGVTFGYKTPGPLLSGILMAMGIVLGLGILRWAAQGTLFRTPAFLWTFPGVTIVIISMGLFCFSSVKTINFSVARVRVGSWSQPANPEEESRLFNSKQITDSLVQSQHLGETLANQYNRNDLTPEQIAWFLNHFTIIDVYTNSTPGLIDIQFAGMDAQKVADVANALASAYCERRNQSTPGTARIVLAAQPLEKPVTNFFPMLVLQWVLTGLGIGFVAGVALAWFMKRWSQNQPLAMNP